MKTITVVVILIIVVSIVICCISSIISYYYLIKPTSTSTPISTPIPTKSTKQTKIMMYKNLVDDDIFKLYKNGLELSMPKNIHWTDENYETLRILMGLIIFMKNKYPDTDMVNAKDVENFTNRRKKLSKDVGIDTESDENKKYNIPLDIFTYMVVGKKIDGSRRTKDEIIASIKEIISDSLKK